MPLNKRVFLIGLVFVLIHCSSANCFGQEVQPTSLLSVLRSLEAKFDVRFSFTPEDVSKVSLIPPSTDIGLVEALEYLNRNTTLNFSKVNERYITAVLKTASTSTYCATLLNGQTGAPMEGATVLVGDNQYATITDIDGVFYIPNSLISQKITISFIGFENIVLELEDIGASCPATFMQPTVSVLSEVLIRSFLVKGIDRNSDGSTSIKTNNFGLLPGQVENDVLQMAQAIPGVESVDETISTINIRGGNNDENLIMWEGVRMYQTGHFFGLITAFNPNITETLTIYKNGTPAQFGEGVSGVIDMRSNDQVVSDLNGGVGLNLINAGAFVNVPLGDNASIQVSGRYSNNEIWQTPVYNTYSERIFQDTEITAFENQSETTPIETSEDFQFFDFSTKILWDISNRDKLRIHFLTIDNQLDFNQSLTATERSITNNLEEQSSVGGISWDRLWNSKLSTSIAGYGTYYNRDALNRDVFTTQEQFQETEVLETGVKANAIWRILDAVSIEGGYHFSEVGVSNTRDINLPRFRDLQKDVLRSHIGFIGGKFTPNGDKTIVYGGLRANYFENFGEFRFEPRLSVHQKIGSGFALEAAGEIKSQTATQRIDLENDFLGVEKRRWVLADNKDVPIKESMQGSLGLLYNKNNWLVNLEGFYKVVEGVTTASQGFENQFQFVRTTGEYEVMGLEFTFNKKIKDFSAWLSYSYKESNYNFPTLTPPEFPTNLDIRHTGTLAASYQIDAFKISAGANYHTGKPYTTPVDGDEVIVVDQQEIINFDLPNNERLDDYLRVDVSAEYVWRISNDIDAKFNLAVLNVLDRENTLNIRYDLNDNDGDGEFTISEIEETSLGLTPNLSVLILF